METIKNIFDNITSETQTKELYAIFKSFEYPIINVHFSGQFVVRSRVNKKGKDFNYISDLSYPPDNYCEQYGRANLPYHSMFYCCSFPEDKDSANPRTTALFESSKFINNKALGIERITYSKWNVTEELNLIALPFSTNYEKPISDIIEIQRKWAEMKHRFNRDALSIMEYMSDEIADGKTTNSEYFKIANFVYYLLYMNQNTKDFDGIIYPSVPIGGNGYNIVLKPKAADIKLHFENASLCFLVKRPEDTCLITINHSVGINDDGSLKYEPRNDFNMEILNGLDFIN